VSKILVTGGAGFIGSNLVSRLINSGHEVIVLDDFSSGHRTLVHKQATLVEGSVVDDDVLSGAFAFKPDYVMHLAALFANQNSVDHPEKDLEVNGLGTMKVFEWSKRADVRKVLYVSSSCVYGNREVMDEADEAFHPDTPYAITKLLGERYARFWAAHHGMDIVTVRLFNTYGPGELPGLYRNVIPNFIGLALRGEPLTITGTGEETRDFTYVDDTVRGMCMVLFGDTQPGDVFNVATGRKTRIIEIAEIINNYLDNKSGVVYRPRRDWDSVINRQANVEKIGSLLGFKAESDLTSTVQRTCDWIRQHLKHGEY
jgi:UDP-glucose 4-epimerase